MELSEDGQKVGTQSVVRLVGVDSVCVCFFFKVGFTTVDDETLGDTVLHLLFRKSIYASKITH